MKLVGTLIIAANSFKRIDAHNIGNVLNKRKLA